MRERWKIPDELGRSLIERLGRVVQDFKARSGDALSAARVILSASKINLDSIPAIIKAETHTELERRVRELELLTDPGKNSGSW